VVTGTTTYPDRVFSNLWVIRLTPEGTCREFTEWWMEHQAELQAARRRRLVGSRGRSAA
jgi:hypothetical protein